MSTTQWGAGLTMPVSEDRDHIQGPADAAVTVVEYDVERFDRELTEHVHAARVREDFMSGVRSGVNGTPTFYVNGVRHDDSYDLETMHAALERAATAERP